MPIYEVWFKIEEVKTICRNSCNLEYREVWRVSEQEHKFPPYYTPILDKVFKDDRESLTSSLTKKEVYQCFLLLERPKANDALRDGMDIITEFMRCDYGSPYLNNDGI